MKTTLRTIGMLLVAVMVSFAMTACGDDDKKDDNEPDFPGTNGNRDSALIGTWKSSESGYEWDSEYTYVFNKNGTYTFTEKYREFDYYDTYIQKGKWETSGIYLLTIVTSCTDTDEVGETSKFNYIVDGNVLYLDDDLYIRQ